MLSSRGSCDEPDIRERSRIRRRRRQHHHVTFAVCILLSACMVQTSPFSIHPPPYSSSTSPRNTKWKSRLRSSTSSEPKRANTILTEAATIKGAIASASTTDEKISQLKKQQAHNNSKRKKKKQQHPKSSPSSSRFHNNKNNQRRRHSKHGGGAVRQHLSVAQKKKRRVRYLYSKARSLEKRGAWREASEILESILELEPKDAHSYLALARLESRRERGNRNNRASTMGRIHTGGEETADSSSDDGIAAGSTKRRYEDARQIFEIGTSLCPSSVHLWHAWAMHEQSLGNIPEARRLLDRALELDPWNGYVCHAYGLLEMQQSQSQQQKQQKQKQYGGAYNDENVKKALQLWQRGLTYQPSAALVCSLGALYVSSKHPNSARELYSTYIPKLKSERERIEVYLAASSLEETVYRDIERASQLLKEALASGDDGSGSGGSVHDSRAYVALARLGTSGGLVDDLVVKKRLKEICIKQWRGAQKKRPNQQKAGGGRNSKPGAAASFPVKDGRLFNAWAKLESKGNNLKEARKILYRGMKMYPSDHTLKQAAGNIEERLGNVSAARDLYSASLHIEPSAPALIAYAMLELRRPEHDHEGHVQGQPNVTMVRKLFDEALLIDPKHGPAYNAYGNLERREGDVDKARQLYEDGINANCTDAPSVYHGLAKLHLSLGEVEEARDVLRRGLSLFVTGDENKNDDNTYATQRQQHRPRNENVAFLAHTLAMIELNINGDPHRAKAALERGLYHNRNSPQLLLAMALCESRSGNEGGARDFFERSLKADQGHAQAWQAFGVMEMRAGNFRTARTLFECGLKNSPGHGALWQAYGTLESWKGNITNARLLFAAGIQKCPKHVPLYQAWACLELRSGDVVTAKRLITEALTRDKQNGSGWLVAAEIEEKMNNHGLVSLILRRGIECSPGDTELYRALADNEIRRGRIDSARELLEKGIEINPLHAPLYHSLAELEARVFNIEGLARLNKRTAEIFPSGAMTPGSVTPDASSTKRMQAWGKTIKQQHQGGGGRSGAKISDGIMVLAERIGVDSDGTNNNMTMILEDVDPTSLVNNMCGFDDKGSDGLLMFQHNNNA
eukprot:CAMPEP_0181115484 /NCGR_PEP_ID=MMETSP1071-20121207/21456_1 /TAXON_ID=35127 /ORGANISM="Thalassiosira sp., Strain NH16" /LENGTH=1081 /DNA_ID=CAMNT_0023199693 /DNA_START=394 /DNA_END=3635 /DNA_ORIENTATION=+